MLKQTLVILSLAISTAAIAGPKCKEQGTQQGLSGQPLRDFVVKCERKVTYLCQSEAREKNLTGGNKTIFIRKCRQAAG